MPEPRDPEKGAGFAPGKKVWFRPEFDAMIAAKRVGATSGVLVGEGVTAVFVTAGGETVRLRTADGSEHDVAVRHLRLTPPPSASSKTVKAKAPKPKTRKEAIRPETGVETTIFDYLEA